MPDLHNTRFKDLQVRVTEKISDVMLRHFARNVNIGSSVAIIWNTTEELDQVSLSKLQQFYDVPDFPIGPFHKMASNSSTSLKKEDGSCMIWLDKQAPNSVLYVSLGSLATIDEKELEETAWGLANSGQPFLWVVRPSLVDGSEWIERLPKGFRETVGEKGQIVKWAPQTKVLAHSAVGGFLSHCGWNSTLESICEAVPMICRPCFGDQSTNCRHITYTWKVGLELENARDRCVIERTIRKLMVEDEGRELRQRMLVMKRKLEKSIQKGGCSHKSLNDLTEFIISLPDRQIDKATLINELSYVEMPKLTT